LISSSALAFLSAASLVFFSASALIYASVKAFLSLTVLSPDAALSLAANSAANFY